MPETCTVRFISDSDAPAMENLKRSLLSLPAMTALAVLQVLLTRCLLAYNMC